MHDQKLLDRAPRDRPLRMVRRIAQRVEHHHAVRHRRIDRAEAVLAVEPLADPRHRARRSRAAASISENIGSPQRSRLSAPRKNQNSAAFCCGAFGAGPSVAGGSRNSSSIRIFFGFRARGLQRHQHQQRDDDGAAPIGNLVEMEWKPFREQHDLDRHHRHRAPRNEAEQRQHQLGEDVGARRAAARPDLLPRPRHVRRIDGIADHLEREIGLHARAQIEVAVLEQRPAAVLRALRPPQIDRDLALPVRHRPARRDNGATGRIRAGMVASASSSKHHSPSGRLAIEQRPRRRAKCCGRDRADPSSSCRCLPAMTTSAARLPDRTALSNVAGNPVAVQSPARTRLFHCVRAPGRLAFSSGVATKVARRSRTICHGGSSAAIPVARDTSCQIV